MSLSPSSTHTQQVLLPMILEQCLYPAAMMSLASCLTYERKRVKGVGEGERGEGRGKVRGGKKRDGRG